jgi:hypothetical protein
VDIRARMEEEGVSIEWKACHGCYGSRNFVPFENFIDALAPALSTGYLSLPLPMLVVFVGYGCVALYASAISTRSSSTSTFSRVGARECCLLVMCVTQARRVDDVKYSRFFLPYLHHFLRSSTAVPCRPLSMTLSCHCLGPVSSKQQKVLAFI